MGLLEDIGNTVMGSVTLTLRRFTSFLFILFAGGLALGWHIMNTNPQLMPLAILITLGLALLSYVNTAFATIAFLVLAIILFVL